ncbi:MAG: hypothetical protein KJ607_13350 [Bacteroidetes bacterium]|nr:hypothetical protein [Bacteroidota bacterium]
MAEQEKENGNLSGKEETGPSQNTKPKDKKSGIAGIFRDLIDGTVLTREGVVRQLPFIVYLVFLAVIYIANRYNAEKIVRETIALQNELKELRSKKIAVESELMFISKQSLVAKMVEENDLGLVESVVPPMKISESN